MVVITSSTSYLVLMRQPEQAKIMYPTAMMVFGGDFNARVGCTTLYDKSFEGILGTLLPTQRNRNGNELLLFSQHTNMLIANSFLSYPENGVGTWYHSTKPHIFEHTLDHILFDMEDFTNLVLEGGAVDKMGLQIINSQLCR